MKNALVSHISSETMSTAHLVNQLQETKKLIDKTLEKMIQNKECVRSREKTNEIITLCRASKNEDIRRYAELLEKTYDINAKDTWNNEDAGPLLLQVIYDREMDILKSLIAHPDILVNETDGELTALMWATTEDYAEAVELLLSQPGILLNKKNNAGMTALMSATYRGSRNIIKLLLTHPDLLINEEDKPGGWTALVYAAHEKRIDILGDFLEDPRMNVHAHNQLSKAYKLTENSKIKSFLKQKLDFYGIVV